ncbi:MAG: hypothetical protein GC134_08895 [Proteobacteria bacterium]|nr:hypothetical protein [Pseudomonadota bacterium]
MIQFTIGLILSAFALIVGGFQFMENLNGIKVQRNQLAQAIRDKQEAGKFAKKIEAIKEVTLKKGEDQKLNIERAIELPKNVEFKYTSEADPNSQDNRFFYRHNFEITGLTDFVTGLRLVNKLENMNGFVLFSACFGCLSLPSGAEPEPNQRMIQIKGFVYVYNPETVNAPS